MSFALGSYHVVTKLHSIRPTCDHSTGFIYGALSWIMVKVKVKVKVVFI